jgi:hypothetical protein
MPLSPLSAAFPFPERFLSADRSRTPAFPGLPENSSVSCPSSAVIRSISSFSRLVKAALASVNILIVNRHLPGRESHLAYPFNISPLRRSPNVISVLTASFPA